MQFCQLKKMIKCRYLSWIPDKRVAFSGMTDVGMTSRFLTKTFFRISILTIVLLWLSFFAVYANDFQPAYLLEMKGAIGPATQDYFHRNLKQAIKKKAPLVILQIDTPGGLSESMREIIKDILASPLPIIAYVAPSGARAASAGTYILYASQIAAMAPGTNLGAATPVNLTESKAAEEKNASENKAINDAKAYIRSLAELRHRNVDWAELAVSRAASLSAEEALQKKVIDIVSPNVTDLLTQTDGRQVSVQGQLQFIHSKGLPVQTLTADWRTRFLATITDPSIAYILLMIGIYGLIFEFINPGFIMPGLIGAIALMVGLYALHLLPINYAGLGLMVLGLSCIIAEFFMPTFGALGIGGIVAFLIGSIMLLKPGAVGFTLPVHLIIAVTAVTAIFFLSVLGLALRSRRRPIITGREAMIGKIGEVQIDRGRVWIDIGGERWQPKLDQKFHQGQKVKVISISGLKLSVKPTDNDSPQTGV